MEGLWKRISFKQVGDGCEPDCGGGGDEDSEGGKEELRDW